MGERSYGKSSVSLWKFFLILVLFPLFNAYETVYKFETSGEEPVPSQPALHAENKT